MFGYTYKIVPVNPEKHIYKLRPTASTWVKAFAPALVIWAVAAIALTASKEMDTIEVKDVDDNGEWTTKKY